MSRSAAQQFVQVLKEKASIFRLADKSWVDCGRSGQLIVYHYLSRPNDILVRWWRQDTGQSLAFQIAPGHIKLKGSNSWVVRAMDLSTKPATRMILAFRFESKEAATDFKRHFDKVTAAIAELSSDPKKAKPAWICKICTFKNAGADDLCRMCHTAVVTPATALKPAPGGLSPREAKRSLLSGKPKRKASKSEWKCSVCTLTNESKTTKCAACNTPRGYGVYGAYDERREVGGGTRKGMVGETAGGSDDEDAMISSHRYSSQSSHSHSSGGLSSDGSQRYLRENSLSDASHSLCDSMGSSRSLLGPHSAAGGMDSAGKIAVAASDFSRAATDISVYNDNCATVFSTLQSVARKLVKDDIKYRSLDTTNPRVMGRLLGFEGVPYFLQLLGFESDAMGVRLVCKDKPDEALVLTALDVLKQHEYKQKTFASMARGDAPAIGSMDTSGSGVRVTDDYGEDVVSEMRRLPVAAMIESPLGKEAVSGIGAVLPFGVVPVPRDIDDDDLTLRQIILWCTHPTARDSETMLTLFMCHLEFSSSLQLLVELRNRFFTAAEGVNARADAERFREKNVKPAQLRVLKFLRNWMKKYWQDFGTDEMHTALESLFDVLDIYSDVEAGCEWVAKMVTVMRTEVKRYETKAAGQLQAEELADGSGGVVEMIASEPLAGLKLAKHSAEDWAQQITQMDFAVFKRISPRECLGQAWKKKDGRKRAANILALIQQFNNVTVWVQATILKEKGLRSRTKMMKKMVKMGQCFRAQRNYNALCAVFSALNSACIHRLKHTWNRVPSKQLTHLNEFQVIFSREKNQRNLRQLFRSAVAPCIPHIGLFLQDLVFIDDGNEDERKESNFDDRSMINFSKSVRTADRVKRIQMFQQQPYSKLKSLPRVQQQLAAEFAKCAAEFDEDKLWELSSKVKLSDERDAASYF